MDPVNAYDAINVRDTWFSAATYFRRADFYLHGNWSNPLINDLWTEQIAAFDKAMAALPIPGQRLRIAADNFTIEATWYAAAQGNCTRRPTLVLGNGYDGAQEDLYHTVVQPALARGWNCLTYEGPGHPLVRRNQELGFIYDWERVVTPLVDYLLAEKASVVDADRLVLFGYSFGGYLAARAAAFEPRFSAVVLNGGVWDTFAGFTQQLPDDLLDLFNSGDKAEFDDQIMDLLASSETPSTLRWGVEQGLWSFRAESPFDFLEMSRPYHVKDIITQIKVPVWIADAEYEAFYAGQSKIVKEAFGDQATLHTFRGSAGYHCQVGALQEMNRVMFGWLHQTLG